MSTEHIQAELRANQEQVREDWIAQQGDRLSPQVEAAIRRNEVLVGMSFEEAQMAWIHWGPPSDRIVTRTAAGESTQWVFRQGNSYTGYRYRFLYTEEGVVTAVQY